MWNRKYGINRWCRKFFRITLSHDNLMNHYKTNFILMQEHKYSLSELENMMPWEREVYIGLLMTHLKKKAEQNQQDY